MADDSDARITSGISQRMPRLQSKIILGVGIISVALSVALGLITYATLRTTLVIQHQDTAVNQFALNAQLLGGALGTTGVDEMQLLGSLRPQVSSRRLLRRDGQWFSASLQLEPDDLPQPLLEEIDSGAVAGQRFRSGDEILYGVGVALPRGDAVYVEVFSLNEVNDALRTLRNTLLLAGALATAAAVGLGVWVAKRVTAPLRDVSEAAQRIAGGELDTRLDSSADRDLQALTVSFNQMAEALKGRIDQERRFASDVSHELRSPLTTLLTSVAVLENRRSELSPDGQEALDLLSADVHRFQRMVSDLIEIAKHDAGSAEVSWAYTRASDCILSVLRRLRADQLPIDITERAAEAVIRIDTQRMERTLANLIENASFYGDEATRVSLDADDSCVWIAVEDRGPGIPEEERERIFERFARGIHSRHRANTDGSGLGLALAVENLAIVGGRIWVENRDGGGARFVIELPRVQE